jgi:hypothetical protein
MYILITNPQAGCKTCGRIPIHYPNATDGTNTGGILKIDFKADDNCIGKCVGPNSFTNTSTSPTASASSKSAATRLEVLVPVQGAVITAIMVSGVLLGASSILFGPIL